MDVDEFGRFCARGRASRCVPSTDTHTFSCKAREALGRTVLDYLRDVREDKRRADLVRKRGRPLGPVTVFALFLDWMRCEAEIEVGISTGVTNILIHRMIPNLGDFMSAFEIAEEIYAEEVLSDKAQEKLIP